MHCNTDDDDTDEDEDDEMPSAHRAGSSKREDIEAGGAGIEGKLICPTFSSSLSSFFVL